MPYKELDTIYARLANANGIGLDEVVARHYRHDVPKLLAAVEAVLALHRDDAGTCVECSQGRSVTFPCPTLWAINDALEGGE